MRTLALLIMLAGCNDNNNPVAQDLTSALPDLSAGLPRLLFTSDSVSWLPGQVGAGMPTSRFYDVMVDTSTIYDNRPTAEMRYLGAGDFAMPWTGITIANPWPVTNYQGLRIRMSLYVKTDSVVNGAAPWIRIDDPAHMPILLANGFDPSEVLTGTHDFTLFTHVFDMPMNGAQAFFGMLLDRDGTVWSGVATFEQVDTSVALTPSQML
jgi:hypothetical protein